MKSGIKNTLKLILVNSITFARLIGALLLPFFYIKYGASTCGLLTILLFITDTLDGFLARLLKASTFFGSILDGLSDKLLNSIAFIILAIEYKMMIIPLVLELAIILTMYSTYRLGGNVKSSLIGKIKTIFLDIFVISSFILISLPTINSTTTLITFLINNTYIIINILSICITISCLIALYDYINKNIYARKNDLLIKIKHQNRKRKSAKEIIKNIFDHEYYIKNKDQSIIKQFYK